MLSDVALEGSLDDAISALTPALRVTAMAPAAATRLLERLRLGLEDEQGTRKLVRALHRLMPPPPHPTVSEQLLAMLPGLAHPAPVVEELAQVVGSAAADPAALAHVVESYTAALAGDRDLLLPILGSLFDLPLTGSLAAAAARLACEALGVVGEEDVPAVVRTLLKALDDTPQGHRAAREVRRQAGSLGLEALGLVVGVLAEALPLSAAAPRLFLRLAEDAARREAAGRAAARRRHQRHRALRFQRERERERTGRTGSYPGGGGGGSADENGEDVNDADHDHEGFGAYCGSVDDGLGLFDVAVILLLLPQPQHGGAVSRLLRLLVASGTVPFCALRRAASLAGDGSGGLGLSSSGSSHGGGGGGGGGGNWTWQPLLAPLVHLGLWLLLAPTRASAEAAATSAAVAATVAAAAAAEAQAAEATAAGGGSNDGDDDHDDAIRGRMAKRERGKVRPGSTLGGGAGRSQGSSARVVGSGGRSRSNQSGSGPGGSGLRGEGDTTRLGSALLVGVPCPSPAAAAAAVVRGARGLLLACFAASGSCHEAVCRAALALATGACADLLPDHRPQASSLSSAAGVRAAPAAAAAAGAAQVARRCQAGRPSGPATAAQVRRGAAAVAAARAGNAAGQAAAAAAAALGAAGDGAALLLRDAARLAPRALLPLAGALADACLHPPRPEHDGNEARGCGGGYGGVGRGDGAGRFPLPERRARLLFEVLAAVANNSPPTASALLIFIQKSLFAPMPPPGGFGGHAVIFRGLDGYGKVGSGGGGDTVPGGPSPGALGRAFCRRWALQSGLRGGGNRGCGGDSGGYGEDGGGSSGGGGSLCSGGAAVLLAEALVTFGDRRASDGESVRCLGPRDRASVADWVARAALAPRAPPGLAARGEQGYCEGSVP